MSRRWNSRGSGQVRDKDVERQGPENDGIGSEQTTITKLEVNQPASKMFTETTRFHWDVAFLVVCIVAVAVDPLFYYLPVINEATKCIIIDKTLKIIAICVRSFLDLIAFGDLVARPRESSTVYYSRPSEYDVINILAILPVPQVLVPIIFSEMRGSKFRHGRKVLNAVVLSQYVPRLFRIYRSWKIVNKTLMILRIPKSIPPTPGTRVKVNNVASYKKMIKRFRVMKAGFNLFLYLVASHVLGAFWYFFSIERETTCWHVACNPDAGCSKSSFNCGHGSSNNTIILNNFCSIEKPNTTLFDFGIFQEARQSGILESMDFPRKVIFCFWWGLRNLSSLGQNLETSPYYWENCFTVLISIFGLLLFLYFIGNLQVYMQWEASNELEEISKNYYFLRYMNEKDMAEIMKYMDEKDKAEIMKYMDEKDKAVIMKYMDEKDKAEIMKYMDENDKAEIMKYMDEKDKAVIMKYMDEKDKAEIMKSKLRSIECWISTIGLPYQLKQMIMSYVTPILEDQNKHIDTENPFPHLPTKLRRSIKLHLCLPLLRRVPIFENESEELLYEITCKFLKQVHYNQSSYIVREGEPLDALIFMVKGIVWTYTSKHGNKTECLKTGDLFGRHLVDWVLESPGLSNLPLSTRTLKCHTKVEVFCLTASDLKDMMSQCWWKFRKFSHITQSNSQLLKHFAASSIQAAWRHHTIHSHKYLNVAITSAHAVD